MNTQQCPVAMGNLNDCNCPIKVASHNRPGCCLGVLPRWGLTADEYVNLAPNHRDEVCYTACDVPQSLPRRSFAAQRL